LGSVKTIQRELIEYAVEDGRELQEEGILLLRRQRDQSQEGQEEGNKEEEQEELKEA
jgi:hypothetical protein